MRSSFSFSRSATASLSASKRSARLRVVGSPGSSASWPNALSSVAIVMIPSGRERTVRGRLRWIVTRCRRLQGSSREVALATGVRSQGTEERRDRALLLVCERLGGQGVSKNTDRGCGAIPISYLVTREAHQPEIRHAEVVCESAQHVRRR